MSYIFIEKVKRLKKYILTYIKYKKRFGKMGHKCVVEKPILTTNLRNVFLDSCIQIRKNSRIETIEQWGAQKFQPTVTIGKNTSIEQNLHLTCAQKIIIGKNVIISAYVMITDIDHSYQEINKNVLKQQLEVKTVYIGDYCFIGMGAKIMPGSKIGRNCVIGANSIVKGEIPAYSVVVGTPAKVIKKYNFETEKWEKV